MQYNSASGVIYSTTSGAQGFKISANHKDRFFKKKNLLKMKT